MESIVPHRMIWRDSRYATLHINRNVEKKQNRALRVHDRNKKIVYVTNCDAWNKKVYRI